MSKEKCVQFRQSLADFPLTVALGEKAPTWGLSRWRGNSGLRFIPLDDEGFSLRGNKQRLVYKGRRRSHRFTILDDRAFEYDCILNKEPESNVVSLLMEGAECFDFFRQPDFVSDPFLKGSYAVYKKETLIGEGTGKLCHIHRPLIIDARGRRVWGDLSVVGNELRITIPQQWLSEASYPVVVDPTVGTTTIGSQNRWDGQPLMFEVQLPVNRFAVPQTINGLCTAFFYANQDDLEAYGRPVLYSDNGNRPQTRRSSQESLIDLRVRSGQPAGWRSGTFRSNTSIASGSNIWFGLFCEYFWLPRFDFGSRCYTDWWDAYDSIPNTYPIWNANFFQDFRLSMYFTYTSAQNYVRTLTQGVRLSDSRRITGNYRRNALQTVRANSALSRFEAFYRKCEMRVRSTMSLTRFPFFNRTVMENIRATVWKRENRSISRRCASDVNIISVSRRIYNVIRTIQNGLKGLDSQLISLLYARFVADEAMATHKTIHWGAFIRGLRVTAGNTVSLSRYPAFLRTITDNIKTTIEKRESRLILRKCVDDVKVNSINKRIHNVFCTVYESLKGFDSQSISLLFVRCVTDDAIATHKTSHWGSFIRGLLVTAGSTAETTHEADYYRFHADTVQAEGSVFRGLLLFVRVVSQVFIRDYILARFLRARQEIVLKSCVCREITLESKVG